MTHLNDIHMHWQIHKLTSCWRQVSVGWTPLVHCCSPFFLCPHLWHPGSLPAAVKSQTHCSILIITWKQCTMLSFLCLHLSHPGFLPTAVKPQTLCSILIIAWKQCTILFFFCACTFDIQGHASSIAFRHLSPNSARTGYATEGALLSPRSCPQMQSEPSKRVGY